MNKPIIRWIVRLEITVEESKETGVSRLNEDNTETFVRVGSIFNVPKAVKFYKKKYGKIRYDLIVFPRLHSFFSWIGKQNDYLFPFKGCDAEYAESYPFKKAHLWKTRIGFKTAWQLSK